MGAMLRSLFSQSLFAELARKDQFAEVLCITNGCTDRTPQVAANIFQEQRSGHPAAAHFNTRVCEIPERGKINAWNQFVHRLSAPTAEFLFMMDADINIHLPETLWNMLGALEEHPEAQIATDLPRKDVSLKPRKSWRDRLSLAASHMTVSAQAQLCAQLYCIRAGAARNIFLPKDLAACEDGFIKALVCTDSLTGPVRAERICLAPGAEHIFEAYTSPLAILRNQKRQVIGQTIVHLLIDEFLSGLSLAQKQRMAETLRERDAVEPGWLKRLITEHLRRTPHCWRLYPGLLGQRFLPLRPLPGFKRAACFPAALAASGATLLASFLAHRALKDGCTDYWPKAERAQVIQLVVRSQTRGGPRHPQPY